VIDIRQRGPREYDCQEFVFNTRTGAGIAWAPCRLEVQDLTTIRIQSDPIPGTYPGATNSFQVSRL